MHDAATSEMYQLYTLVEDTILTVSGRGYPLKQSDNKTIDLTRDQRGCLAQTPRNKLRVVLRERVLDWRANSRDWGRGHIYMLICMPTAERLPCNMTGAPLNPMGSGRSYHVVGIAAFASRQTISPTNHLGQKASRACSSGLTSSASKFPNPCLD